MKYIKYTRFMIAIFLLTACNKKEWLEEKSNKALLNPSTLQDCRILLDNNSKLNTREPQIGEIGADNYYRPYTDWLSAREMERNMYTWQENIFGAESSAEWRYEYEKIYYANAVLQTMEKITQTDANSDQWKDIKGTALFFRGLCHYNLVKLFARQYDAATAATDAGIPVKTDPDINLAASRGTVKAVYDQVLADLTEAVALLPLTVDFKTRPSRVAAQGLLADVYLTMGDYDKSLQQADAALTAYNTLLDYNILNAAVNAPFTRFNSEVIFHATQITYGMLLSATTYVDTVLLQLYHPDDLRKVLFFRNRGAGFTFKGSYNQNTTPFAGIATDELYLIRAECHARKNNVAAAMNDLNTLLQTRWKTGTFTDYTATDQASALVQVLTERRKELLFRGRRWNDLRRLNREPGLAITLSRNLNNQLYTLAPNSPRYVYPIPEEEIRASGLQQNPR